DSEILGDGCFTLVQNFLDPLILMDAVFALVCVFCEQVSKDLMGLCDESFLTIQIPPFSEDKLVESILLAVKNGDGDEILNSLETICRGLLDEFCDVLSA